MSQLVAHVNSCTVNENASPHLAALTQTAARSNTYTKPSTTILT